MLTPQQRDTMRHRQREIAEELDQLTLMLDDEMYPAEHEEALRSELALLELALSPEQADHRHRAGRRDGDDL